MTEIEAWNNAHPIGTPVRVALAGGGHILSTTNTAARVRLGTPVVQLRDVLGTYPLNCVEVINP